MVKVFLENTYRYITATTDHVALILTTKSSAETWWNVLKINKLLQLTGTADKFSYCIRRTEETAELLGVWSCSEAEEIGQ